MSGNLRAAGILWDAATVSGSASSKAVNIGPQTSLAIFVKSSVGATFKLQTAASHLPSVGANDMPATDGTAEARWFDYLRAEVIEDNSGVEGTTSSLVLLAGNQICVDLSPFAPTFLRLLRTDGGANSVVTAFTVAVG